MTRAIAAACAVALTAGLSAAAAEPTFPGRNGVLVLQRPVGKQVGLFTVPPTAGAVARLTHTAAWEEKAEWSPDGNRLVFGCSRPSGDPTGIATLSFAGLGAP